MISCHTFIFFRLFLCLFRISGSTFLYFVLVFFRIVIRFVFGFSIFTFVNFTTSICTKS